MWRKHYQNDYDYICEKCPDFKKFSFEDFKKYEILCGSRTFSRKEVGLGVFMAPVGDMLNHRNPKMVDWEFNSKT